MAGVQSRAVVVAGRWTGCARRPDVDRLVFHTDAGRSDASGGFTGLGRCGDSLGGPQLRTSRDGARGVADGPEGFRTLLSNARLVGASPSCVSFSRRSSLSHSL